MKRHCLAILMPIVLLACAPAPFYVEQVNEHLYRSSQPRTESDWKALAARLGPAGIIVKLNAEDEGSDDGAAAVGLRVVKLAIEPKGDGPIYAQIEGVFTKPDRMRVAQAVAISCNPNVMVDDHCSYGFDRTGFVVAMERVLCEGWSPEAAHDEWHRMAHYIPYGDRVPAPGLEEAWKDFVDELEAPERAAILTQSATRVMRALDPQ